MIHRIEVTFAGRSSCPEQKFSFSTLTATGAIAMTGLMVGMTGCTGLGAETLAVVNDSTGVLHLADATGTSTDRQSGRH